jgi:hypothetical protein
MVKHISIEQRKITDCKIETFSDADDKGAKQKRDAMARALRKEGWTVETSKGGFNMTTLYHLYAIKTKPVKKNK